MEGGGLTGQYNIEFIRATGTPTYTSPTFMPRIRKSSLFPNSILMDSNALMQGMNSAITPPISLGTVVYDTATFGVIHLNISQTRPDIQAFNFDPNTSGTESEMITLAPGEAFVLRGGSTGYPASFHINAMIEWEER